LCATLLVHAASPASAEEATSGAASSEATVSAEDLRSVEAHLARGLELYGQQHYPEAVAEFRAGYAVHADARLLYALAQALRLAGQCSEAVRYYQRFLDGAPGPAQEAAARANLERCREQASSVGAESSVDPASHSAEAAPPPPARTMPAAPVDRRPVPPASDARSKAPRTSRPAPPSTDATSAWYADTLGATLTGGGLLGVGAGVALLLLAHGQRHEAETLEEGATPGTYQQHADRLDNARVEFVTGGISSAVGATAMVLGALRYYSVAARPGVAFGLTVLPSRATATLGGTF
jgi:hypothetical protein